MKKFLLFSLVITIVFFSTFALIKVSAQQDAMPKEELSISELEKIISDAEKQGNVGARSHIHQYWQLADLYLKNKDYKNAYNIIIKGLSLDSWNYKYQKIASEIELTNQEYEKAYYRLNFIVNNLSELGGIYNDSLQQIKNINIDKAVLSPTNLPGYYVYIATYPDLNSDVVDALSARVSEEYGIEVKTINVGLKESEENIRDRQLDVYDEIIDDVFLRYSKESIDGFLQQIGVSNDAMHTREGKRRFVYALLSQSGDGRSYWEEIELVKSQYSSEALLEQLSRRFLNYTNDSRCLGILGVTSNDIYENDYNFLFGWAQKGLGVISYARFLLGNPTDKQFEKRTVMQALSSMGFVIGIPRCTNPTCARAYPNSLDEQDRKNDKLCDECRENLRRLYLSYQ